MPGHTDPLRLDATVTRRHSDALELRATVFSHQHSDALGLQAAVGNTHSDGLVLSAHVRKTSYAEAGEGEVLRPAATITWL